MTLAQAMTEARADRRPRQPKRQRRTRRRPAYHRAAQVEFPWSAEGFRLAPSKGAFQDFPEPVTPERAAELFGSVLSLIAQLNP